MLGLTPQLFVDNGADIPQRRVPSHPIVKALDVLKHCLLGAGSGGKRAAIHTFSFERAEKALHSCVIVAIARPAHTPPNASLSQKSLIARTGVLTSAIRMEQKLLTRTAASQSHLERLGHPGLILCSCHSPSDQHA